MCSVSFIPVNKLALQESNQSELRCRLHFFPEIFSSTYQYPVGQIPVSPNADAHAITDYFISDSTNMASSSNETNKRFWLIVCKSKFLASLVIK